MVRPIDPNEIALGDLHHSKTKIPANPTPSANPLAGGRRSDRPSQRSVRVPHAHSVARSRISDGLERPGRGRVTPADDEEPATEITRRSLLLTLGDSVVTSREHARNLREVSPPGGRPQGWSYAAAGSKARRAALNGPRPAERVQRPRRYYTFRGEVPALRTGESLGFEAGRGYYMRETVSSRARPAVPQPPGPRGRGTAGGGSTTGLVTAKVSGKGTRGRRIVRSLAVAQHSGGAGHATPRTGSTPHKIHRLINVAGQTVRVTIGASATVVWSGGEGKPGVAFHGEGLSITDGPLTISDPAFLWLFKRLAAGTGAGYTVSDARDPVPYQARIAVGGAHLKTPLGDVEFKTSVINEHGESVVEEEASISFIKKLPNGQKLSVSYFITATFSPVVKPPPGSPLPSQPVHVSEKTWLEIAAALALTLLGLAPTPGRLGHG
jgi:hypothetical protein